jgi:hypothetical protein
VATEFRVFDGTTEVTARTRVRAVPAGRRTDPGIEAKAPVTPLPPAMYDVQALLTDAAGVATIKWAERLSIIHYPDEGGRHLEVINFRPGFGALQLRPAPASLDDNDEVAIFQDGTRTTPAAQPFKGEGYVLFVVPAGRYDVRVQHAGPDRDGATHWLLGIDVPPDRTRLRLIEPPG